MPNQLVINIPPKHEMSDVCHCGLGVEDHIYPGAAEHSFLSVTEEPMSSTDLAPVSPAGEKTHVAEPAESNLLHTAEFDFFGIKVTQNILKAPDGTGHLIVWTRSPFEHRVIDGTTNPDFHCPFTLAKAFADHYNLAICPPMRLNAPPSDSGASKHPEPVPTPEVG